MSINNYLGPYQNMLGSRGPQMIAVRDEAEMQRIMSQQSMQAHFNQQANQQAAAALYAQSAQQNTNWMAALEVTAVPEPRYAPAAAREPRKSDGVGNMRFRYTMRDGYLHSEAVE